MRPGGGCAGALRGLAVSLPVVLAAAVTASCSGSPPAAAHTVSVAPGVTVTLAGGVKVTAKAVPGVTASLTREVSVNSGKRPSLLTVLAAAQHLTASGRLPHGGAVITFHVSPRKVAAGSVPFLASLDPATGRWIPAPSKYNRETGEVSARVTHFSVWVPLDWLRARMAALLKGALLSLLSLAGTGTPPSCEGAPLPVADSRPHGGVGACAQPDGSADALVKVVNERAYPVDLLYPPDARVRPPVADPFALLGAEMTSIASRWHYRLLLPGGGEADPVTALPVGQRTQFATQFDGEAWTLGILGTAINVLVQITPGAGAETAGALIDALGKAHCLAEVVDTAQTATLSLATAQNLGSTALDCLAAAAKGAGGLILTAATIIGSLATDLVSGVWAATDTLLGNTTHVLTVQRPAEVSILLPVVACPSSYGLTQPPTRFPASQAITLPASQASQLSYYSDQARSVRPVLGPRGWRCTAIVGADGGLEISVFPPGGSASGSELVEAGDDSACVGCIYDDACPLVPHVAAELGMGATAPPCESPQPARQDETWLSGSPAQAPSGNDAVSITDPPGVKGYAASSGGRYLATAVLLYSWPSPGTGNPSAAIDNCTLPPAKADLCTTILITFRQQHWTGR